MAAPTAPMPTATWQADDVMSEDDEPTWAPPTGSASSDPDPNDEREHKPPPIVVPHAGAPPVVGQPWTVTAATAAGVSGLVIEIAGRPHNVTMRPDQPSANTSPSWSGTIDDIGPDPVRYRYAWRSSWTVDVTEGRTVTPSRAEHLDNDD